MSTLIVYSPMLVEHLPERAREDFDFWRALIEPLLKGSFPLKATFHRLAAETGISYKTIRNRYYRARAEGLGGLIDRRLCGPEFWELSTRPEIAAAASSEGFLELWKALCESHQRVSKSAHKELLRMWRARDGRIGEIPEYRDFPGWPKRPPGWSYDNLMKHAPTSYELASARIGRTYSASLRPTVFTTRNGLYVASHYMFDDKWNDFFVNTFVERQHGRPLELYSLDYFSAKKLRYAHRVRTKDQEGNYKGVAEIMMRYVLAATLYLDGYSRRGTVLVCEKGTAAVADRIAAALREITGGLVTHQEGGMTGDPAHSGQYPGLAKGNFRFKAALESNNSLEHNRLDHLPGQTGRSVECRPEELAGRLDHNATLLKAYAQLPPEKAALLEFPLLELNQFLDVAAHVFANIANDRDHRLEGWVEAGNVTQLYEFGGLEVTEAQLKPEQRAKLPALLEAGVVTARPVRMTRQEVWDAGKRDLLKLPGWGVCAILGDDLARESAVRDNMFTVQDAEVGPGLFRYESLIRSADGTTSVLRDGETYQTFINPFAPDMIFVRDAAGRYLGEAARIFAPCRGDADAVRSAMGAAARREAELLAPLRARHDRAARAKMAAHTRNAGLLEDVRPEPTKQERRSRAQLNAELAAATRATPEAVTAAGGLYDDETHS